MSPEEWEAQQVEVSSKKTTPEEAAVLSPEDWEASQTSSPAKEEGFLSKVVDTTTDQLKQGGAIVTDLADLVLSTPAWLGGMAAGLVAAEAHSVIPGDQRQGEHYGSAKAVKNAISEKYGNPLRRSLNALDVTSQPEEGETTSPVAAAMGKVGEGLQAVGKGVREATGSKELGEAAEFFAEMLGPPLILKGAHGVYVGGKKVATGVKDSVVTTHEVKTVDPEYAESKIKPEETIADVIHRKYERDALAKKLDEGEATMGELPKPVEGEVSPVEVAAVKEATGRTSDTALAHTDKDGNITLNDAKIDADFKAGFPYIFDASTPTGAQKAAVFERLGVTKEDLVKAIPDLDTYKAFLKAHEESHVRNGDRVVYPRTPEGKADLMHPDAIAIETRATMDALKEINKPSPEDVVTSNVYEFITKEAIDHPSTVEGASLLIEKSLNSILADNRLVEIRSKGIVESIPENSVRTRMTYALDNQKARDALMSDVTKTKLLEGTKLPRIDPKTGDPILTRSGKTQLDEGLVGALKGMDSNLAKGRIPEGLTREEYQIKRDNLEASIEAIRKRPSENKAIEVLEGVKSYLKEIGDKARKVGLIEELRNNYVPHVLDFSKSSLSPAAQTALLDRIVNAPKDSKLVRDFTQERQFEFLRELEKVVKDTGVVVHTDIAKIVDAYGKAMQTAIIHKSMIDFLRVNKAADGNPWLMPDNAVSKGLKYVSFEGKGTRAISDLRVHPDLVDPLGFMFKQKDHNAVLRGVIAVTQLTKAMNVIGSFFHLKSLVEVMALAGPGLLAKEIVTAGSGTRAALKAFKNEANNTTVDLLIREGGLNLKVVEDVSPTIIADMGVFLDGLATKLGQKSHMLSKEQQLNLVQHITNPLDKRVLQHINRWTWEYAHTGFKAYLAVHRFNTMKIKNPDLTDIAIAREVSMFVNKAFGGLNWLQEARTVQNKYARAAALKAAGITGRDYAQLALFAPDWTVSTLRSFTSAFPQELARMPIKVGGFQNPLPWNIREGAKGLYNPRTHADLARRYVINAAIMWATILNGVNIALSGHSIWDNTDPTRIELEDKTQIQGAKHSMEALHWLQHPIQTLGNKLAIIPKALTVIFGGVAYPSPNAPKLKDVSALGIAGQVGALTLPFAVNSLIQAPEGKGLVRAASSTAGFPIYKVSKEDLKKAQKKGRVEAKKKKLEEKRNK